MSPDKLVDENDPSPWVAKTKVAPVKITKEVILVFKTKYETFFKIFFWDI